MHTVTVTTTTPDGQLLALETIATAGDRSEALALAGDLARRATIDIHAADPHQPHAHLVALGDEPHALATARTTATGRTDLLATLNTPAPPVLD